MKHKIDTVEQLLHFLKTNWNKLTDFGYIEVIRETLECYEFNKPETYDIAEKRIIHYTTTYNDPNIEKPLFLDVSFGDFDEDLT